MYLVPNIADVINLLVSHFLGIEDVERDSTSCRDCSRSCAMTTIIDRRFVLRVIGSERISYHKGH